MVSLDRIFESEGLAELLTKGKLSELACLTLYLMYEKKVRRRRLWLGTQLVHLLTYCVAFDARAARATVATCGVSATWSCRSLTTWPLSIANKDNSPSQQLIAVMVDVLALRTLYWLHGPSSGTVYSGRTCMPHSSWHIASLLTCHPLLFCGAPRRAGRPRLLLAAAHPGAGQAACPRLHRRGEPAAVEPSGAAGAAAGCAAGLVFDRSLCAALECAYVTRCPACACICYRCVLNPCPLHSHCTRHHVPVPQAAQC